MHDITELDDTAQRMRVSWRKAINFITSLVSMHAEVRAKIDSGIYGMQPQGHPWNTTSWLLVKAGLSDSQLAKLALQFKRIMAEDDVLTLEHIKNEKAKQRRLAAEQRKQDNAAAQPEQLGRKMVDSDILLPRYKGPAVTLRKRGRGRRGLDMPVNMRALEIVAPLLEAGARFQCRDLEAEHDIAHAVFDSAIFAWHVREKDRVHRNGQLLEKAMKRHHHEYACKHCGLPHR